MPTSRPASLATAIAAISTSVSSDIATDYVVIDWSCQIAPNNAELLRM